MSETVDLGKLEKQIADARKVLARRDAVEREVHQLEAIVVRLNQEIEAAETQLKGVQAKTSAAQAHYDHERNRLTLGLQAHQATCDQAKKDAEREATEARAAADRAISAHKSRADAEQRKIEKDTQAATQLKDLLVSECRALKQRIQALPS